MGKGRRDLPDCCWSRVVLTGKQSTSRHRDSTINEAELAEVSTRSPVGVESNTTEDEVRIAAIEEKLVQRRKIQLYRKFSSSDSKK